MPPKKKTAEKPAVLKAGLEFERAAGFPERRVAGVDEVGRGCLAGPVVAAAVVLPPVVDLEAHAWLQEITDSKALEAEDRERLVPLIEGWAAAFAIGVASVEEIDRINIYHASHLAMRRAVEALPAPPEHLLVDGNAIPKGLRCDATAVVKGDLRCLSIACASILAKVWRDRRMDELDREHPGYGFSGNKGYPTPLHQRALRQLGVTPVHRRSFGPVAEALRGSATPEQADLLAPPEQADLFASE